MLSSPLIYNLFLYELKLNVNRDLDSYSKNEVKQVALTFDNWMNLEFQETFDSHFKENIGLHNFFIRVFSQYIFWFYNDTFNTDYSFNKDKDVFQNFYNAAEIGADYLGESEIKTKVEKTKFIQTELEKENIQFLYLILPSKSKLNKDNLPVANGFYPNRPTNYDGIVKQLTENNVNFIDFAKYITPQNFPLHPLYPQYEVHISQYVTGIVVDSLNKYLAQKFKFSVPKIKSVEYYYKNENPIIDEYVLRCLNLLFKPQQRKTPFVKITYDTINSKRPKIFSIADSYYNNISFSGYTKQVFDSSSYNANQYNFVSSDFNSNTYIIGNNYDLKNEYKKFNLILIINTVPNTSRIGWGFIDEFYDYFKKKSTSSI